MMVVQTTISSMGGGCLLLEHTWLNVQLVELEGKVVAIHFIWEVVF